MSPPRTTLKHADDYYAAGREAALRVFIKVANPNHGQRLANAVIQGGTGLLMNAFMAPPGHRARLSGISALADGLGGYVGGMPGMGISLAGNAALQHLTAPKPTQDPNAFQE